MNAPVSCPACAEPFEVEASEVTCREGHRYTPLGLALVTNVAAVKALWSGVRALEDDAAGLEWLADRGDVLPEQAEQRRAEAASARAAAAQLREYAEQARVRLDELPVAPSTMVPPHAH